MRILLTSDTHWGITTDGQIRNMLKKAVNEDFDIIIHAGDYSGGMEAHKKVKQTVEMIRKFFPDKPYLTVIGNHDFWMKGKTIKSRTPHLGLENKVNLKPSQDQFHDNLARITQIFKENKVHFFDTEGLYHHPAFPHIVFMGSSGWYNNSQPPTNDARFLPVGLEGDTNRYLLNRANKIVYEQMDAYEQFANSPLFVPKTKLVFVSHFGVINTGDDYKGGFETFSWSASLGQVIQDDYLCKYFINGHAHQLHQGPLRYESGSDYGKPKYIIMEIE